MVHCAAPRSQMFSELKFSYEEEERADEFFVPYVWQLVVAHSGIPWNPACISMFHVRAAATAAEVRVKDDLCLLACVTAAASPVWCLDLAGMMLACDAHGMWPLSNSRRSNTGLCGPYFSLQALEDIYDADAFDTHSELGRTPREEV